MVWLIVSGSICFPQLTVKISHIDLSNEKVGCGVLYFFVPDCNNVTKRWLNIIIQNYRSICYFECFNRNMHAIKKLVKWLHQILRNKYHYKKLILTISVSAN